MKDIRAYILGGSGYGGGELLRLLSAHPHVESLHAGSRKYAGEPLWKAHPNLRGTVAGRFEAEPDWSPTICTCSGMTTAAAGRCCSRGRWAPAWPGRCWPS